MKDFLRSVLSPAGGGVAKPSLVFYAITVVAILQLPAHILMRKGFASLGILANELLAVAGGTMLLIKLAHLDRCALLKLGRVAKRDAMFVISITIGMAVIIDYFTWASEYFLAPPLRVTLAMQKLLAAPAPLVFVWKLFLLCLLPAVCEELFFRGFCQTSLTARFGGVKGILIASAIFAALHGNPWYLHLYFFLGLIIGWVYYETGSLLAAMLCHFVNNAWTFASANLGFRLPFGGQLEPMDILFFTVGVFVFVFSTIKLKKTARAD